MGAIPHAEPDTFAEIAGFADLTYHVTDRFDIQFGGRESENKQAQSETIVGPYATLFDGASPTVYPEVHTKGNSFTYLVTPKFNISPDLMVYARLASGYRPGGPNTNASLGVPVSYRPDTTENYEIGVKGDVLNHVLSFDASVYYIDWKNIQLRLTEPTSGQTYFANGSSAKSEGVELSTEATARPG